MAGRLELDVLAEHLVELVPDRRATARERQLGEVAALLAHAAEIDAARAGAAHPLLEQHDGHPGLAQRDGSGAAGDAAADDRDIGRETLRHGALPRTGIGLTGGWPRSRPTLSTSTAAGAREKLRRRVAADAALAAAHADARQRLQRG